MKTLEKYNEANEQLIYKNPFTGKDTIVEIQMRSTIITVVLKGFGNTATVKELLNTIQLLTLAAKKTFNSLTL